MGAVLLLLLSACATVPDITQSRSPCRMEPGGWCSFVREAATDGWIYAIAATNAYVGDDDVYRVLPDTLKPRDRVEVDPEDADKGFDYQIFDQYEWQTSYWGWLGISEPELVWKARIVAFRGTDLGFRDVYFGSLRNDQIGLARKYFDLERAREGAERVPQWIVTGHSLGGALATEVSATYPEVKGWMFNTSPFLQSDPMQNDTNRMIINERGDWLGQFRQYRGVPAAQMVVINCRPDRNSFTKHRIRLLSDCILWIAAYDSDEAAALLEANQVPKPPVECGADDKRHPRLSGAASFPCAHMAMGRQGR